MQVVIPGCCLHVVCSLISFMMSNPFLSANTNALASSQIVDQTTHLLHAVDICSSDLYKNLTYPRLVQCLGNLTICFMQIDVVESAFVSSVQSEYSLKGSFANPSLTVMLHAEQQGQLQIWRKLLHTLACSIIFPYISWDTFTAELEPRQQDITGF